MTKKNNSEEKKYTKKEIASFLTNISEKISEGDAGNFHAMLALNNLFRLPNASDLFDKKLKEQAKELWMKLKVTGLHLADPPLLFGPPEFSDDDSSDYEDAALKPLNGSP
jgi:hypothetical protein